MDRKSSTAYNRGMGLFHHFLPETVLVTSSRYNPEIRVVREREGMKLLVNGSRQSGPYIQKLWQAALGAFHLDSFTRISSILVLGVGGGTVITLLTARYPEASITAVDIDPVIIGIAKKYFHLDHISNLQLLHGDAQEFVKRHKRYDLIIIDLFIGREIPSFVGVQWFYKNLKRNLTPGGVCILNYLQEREYQEKSEALLRLMSDFFPTVSDYRIANNRFFLLR